MEICHSAFVPNVETEAGLPLRELRNEVGDVGEDFMNTVSGEQMIWRFTQPMSSEEYPGLAHPADQRFRQERQAGF